MEALLVEALVHVLVEKGVLTRNDALGIVQTVATIKRGALDDPRWDSDETAAQLRMLLRMYASFEALEERADRQGLASDNVHQLRPSLHDTRPEFPHED